MAALTLVTPSPAVPLFGGLAILTLRSTTGSAGTADEWLITGLRRIDAVLGAIIKGTAGATGTVDAPVAAVDTYIAAVGDTKSIANNEIVTIDGQVYTFKDALSVVTPAVKATGTVTFGTPNTADNDTIKIGDFTYKVETTVAAPKDIDLDNAEITQAANLTKAIGIGSGEGTNFGTDTAINTKVTASAGGTAVVTVTALVPGTVGNAIALERTETNSGAIVVSASTLTGGLDAVVPAGNEILIGADDDATLANLRDAINGAATAGTDYSATIQPNTVVTVALTGTGDSAPTTLTLTARVPGAAANAVVFTTNATGVTVTGSGTLGGGTPGVDSAFSSGSIGLNFVLNAQGTGVAEGSNPGDLGVEAGSATLVFEVTVLGVLA